MIDLIGRMARMIDPAAEWARVTDQPCEHQWVKSHLIPVTHDSNFRVCKRCDECGWSV